MCQLIGAGLKLCPVGGVDAVTQQILGNAKGIPGIVDHQDLAGILFVPQQFPTGHVCLVNILGVVQNTHSAPGIGNGVLVLRVVGGVLELVIHILEVGDVFVVQLQEHIGFDHPVDHIIGGDDHVHGDAAVAQLGEQSLVGLVIGHIDLDVGVLFFKGSDDVQGTVGTVGHIHTPVLHIQDDLFLTVAEEQETAAYNEGYHQQTCDASLGDLPAGRNGTQGLFLLAGAQLHQVHTHHQHSDQQEQQGKHGVNLGLNGLL